MNPLTCTVFSLLGTSSRIKGSDFNSIYHDMEALHLEAYPRLTDLMPMLRNPGAFHFRNGGEAHLNTPEGQRLLDLIFDLTSEESFCIGLVHIINFSTIQEWYRYN